MILKLQKLETMMPDATLLERDKLEIESFLNYLFLVLGFTCLKWRWRSRSEYCLRANSIIYFSSQQLRDFDFIE
ncbi:MAG: hypothetical protein WBA93_19215 [Microcoleaceae cyanobacterium]